MKNDLRSAFDKIQAEDALKIRTARYLNMEINKRSQTGTRSRFRLAAVCAAILLFVLVGGYSFNLYFTPTAYVDLDVNPSIGLTLNCFDRVIENYAYNDDGTMILSEVNIRFKKYDEAMRILLDAIISKGYLLEDGLVSVSVQAGGNSGNDMLEWLEQLIVVSLVEHHANAETDVFTVTDEVRLIAHEHHITPAKYIAILELQAIDPTVTFEGCAGHSIGEIRERIRNHGGNHHIDGDDTLLTDGEHGQPTVDDRETEEHHDQSNGNGNGEHPQENDNNHHGENNGSQSAGANHGQSESEYTPIQPDNGNGGHHGGGNDHH